MRAAVLGMMLLCGLAQGAEPKSIGMKLIQIPAGKFTMGSPVGEKGHFENEVQARVTLTKQFWLGKTEVTQGQWKQVMGTEPWKGKDDVQADKDCPATYVSWDDATFFCERLTAFERKAGKLKANEAYRLPTEAEWEYACRAGTTTAYSFADVPLGGEYAWFDGNAMNAGEEYAHKVGMKKPNPWGLYDMHGNVMEWCSDWYDETLPDGGIDPPGAVRGLVRVIRGGSWGTDPKFCRSSSRGGYVESKSNSDQGFRVARSLVAQ